MHAVKRERALWLCFSNLGSTRWLLSFSRSMFYFTSLLLLLHFIKTIQSVLRFWCLWPRETCSAQRQKAAVSLSAWKRESAH
jgi:hypothetical protein